MQICVLLYETSCKHRLSYYEQESVIPSFNLHVFQSALLKSHTTKKIVIKYVLLT